MELKTSKILLPLILLLIILPNTIAITANNTLKGVNTKLLSENWFKYIDTNKNYIDDTLEKEIGTAGTIRAIVGFSTKPTSKHLDLIKAIGVKIVAGPWRYALNGIAVEIPANKLFELRDKLLALDLNGDGYSDLLYIERDTKLTPQMHYVARAMNFRPYLWEMGYKGKYTTVAVIDSGVDVYAPGLKQAYLAGRLSGETVTDEEWYYDYIGHGTSVTYILIGSYNGTVGHLPLSSGIRGPISPGTAPILLIPQFQVYSTGTLQVDVFITPYISGSTYTAYLLKMPKYGNTRIAAENNDYSVVTSNSTWDYLGDYLAHTRLTYTISNSSNYATYVIAIYNGDSTNDIYAWYQAWVPSIVSTDDITTYNISTGLLPEGRVYMLKVADSSGNMYESYIVSAIDRAIVLRDSLNISVISMSLSMEGYTESLRNATYVAVSRGIPIVAAAGNDGATSGQGHASNTYPSAFPWVISVAALDGFYNVTSYSSQGDYSTYDSSTLKPDVAAIGGDFYFGVYAADSNDEKDHMYYSGGWQYYEPSTVDLEWFGGTSAATPIVAAEVALIVEVFREKPYNSTASLWDRLLDVTPLGAVYLVKDIVEAATAETYPMTRVYNGTNLTAYSPTLERGWKDIHEGFGAIDPVAAVELAEYIADYLVNPGYPYDYKLDDNVTPLIHLAWSLRNGVAYNPPNPPHLFNFPYGRSVGGLLVHFERYVWKLNGYVMPTIYGIRVIADTSDQSNADFDAQVYIYNSSTWDIDRLAYTTGGKGVTDEIIYFTPPTDENETGVDHMYYVMVKRATEDSVGGIARLYIGPSLEARFTDGHWIWLNATAASPSSTAPYALVMVYYRNATGVYIHKYAIASTSDLNGLANINGYIDIDFDLQDDQEWFVGVVFTSDKVGPNNITSSDVVEGPMVVEVNIGEPMVLTLQTPASVYDHESFELVARLIYNDTEAVAVGKTVEFYRSTDLSSWSYIGSATTNSTGYATLTWSEPDNGEYYYLAIYPGDNKTQYTISYAHIVRVYMRTNITITVSNTNPYTVEPVTVTAKLTELVDGDPIQGEPITIWISYDGGSTWSELYTGTTNASGEIQYTHVFISQGSYVLKANYSGNPTAFILANESTLTTITSTLTPTNASITHNGTDLRVYDTVAFTVQLNYTYDSVTEPIGGVDVYLEMWDGASWNIVDKNPTDNNGYVTLFYTFTANGTYSFRIHYPGNDTYEEYISSTYTLSVLSLNTSITLSTVPTTGYVGQTLQATIQLLDEKGRPIGSAKVSLMKLVGAVWQNITTSYTGADGYATLSWSESSEGTYTYKVVYEGKPYVYNGTESSEFTVEIQPLTTGLSLSVNATTVYVNESFKLTAQLVSNGNPVSGETIEFQYWNGSSWVTIGTNTTDSNGYAYYTLSERYAGNYTYRAYYPGSPQYNESVSNNVTVEVKPLPTSITLTAPSTAYVTQYITVTVHLELASPYSGDLANEPVKLWVSSDGTTWSLVDEKYTDSNGDASFTISFSNVGTYYIKANYTDPGKASGEWEYSDSETTTWTITVTKVSTTLTLTANNTSPYVDETIEFTAHLTRDNDTSGVSGEPIELQKWNGSNWVTVATAYTNDTGYAVFTLPAGYAGTYQYRAVYSGSTVYDASTNTSVTIDVQPIPTQLTLTATPSTVNAGETFTLEATLLNSLNSTPIAGYTVKFWRSTDGSAWTYIGEATTQTDGTASITWSESVSGTYYYKANFTDPGKTIGSWVYDDSESNTVTVSVGVTPTQLTLTANTTETTVGKTFKLIAYLETQSGTPIDGAEITFQYWNGTSWVDIGTATTNSSGYAVLEHSESYAGNYTYRAVYSGNATYGGSTSNSLVVEVKPIETTLTLTGDTSGYTVDELTYTATLTTSDGTPIAGYTVLFWISSDGSTWSYLGENTTDSSGIAVLHHVFWVQGTYYIKANFTDPGKTTGSWIYGDSESSILKVTITRTPTQIQLTVNNTSPYINESVEYVAKLTDTYGNPVYPATLEVYVDGSLYTTINVNASGIAVFTLSYSTYNTVDVYVSYSGNYTYGSSTSTTVTVTWNPLPLQLTLSSSASTVNVGSSFTLTVYVEDTVYNNPVDGYTVKFWRSTDGITWSYLGEATLVNGYASITTSESATGTYYYKANFTDPYRGVEGQWKYEDGESNTVTVNVQPLPGTTLTLTSNTTSTYVGMYVELYAKLVNETGDPLEGYEIVFYVLQGASWVEVGRSNTNASGIAVLPVTSNTAGTYKYKAVFQGSPDYSGSESNNLTLTFNRRPIDVSVTTKPSEIYVGDTVTIIAYLTSFGEPVANHYVELKNGTTVIATTYTNATGYAVFTITASKAGYNNLTIYAPATSYYDEALANFSFLVKHRVEIEFNVSYTILGNGSIKFILTAKLLIDGSPYAGQNVSFYKKGSWIFLGNATTNPSGIAQLVYVDNNPQPTYTFRADYNSTTVAIASASTIKTVLIRELHMPAPETPLLPLILLAILVLVLIVWGRRGRKTM